MTESHCVQVIYNTRLELLIGSSGTLSVFHSRCSITSLIGDVSPSDITRIDAIRCDVWVA